MTKKRIVLKVGSSILSDGYEINKLQIQKIARLISALRERYDVLLVSSGAVASGYTLLKIDKTQITNKQALASIGQPLLMESYRLEFVKYGIITAQILVTGYNFDSRTQTRHAKDCVDTLLAHGILPILNENDTTSTKELTSDLIGDNDRLGAYVTHYFDAGLLAILSDIDGYYDSHPKHNPDAKILSHITQIQPDVLNEQASPNGYFATGGIVTKLQAAQFLLKHNRSMFLSNGNKLEVIQTFLLDSKQISGTLFSNYYF